MAGRSTGACGLGLLGRCLNRAPELGVPELPYPCRLLYLLARSWPAARPSTPSSGSASRNEPPLDSTGGGGSCSRTATRGEGVAGAGVAGRVTFPAGVGGAATGVATAIGDGVGVTTASGVATGGA